MTKTLTPYTCLLLIMLMMSCAKMGQPDGGWFDETPPAIVGSTPGDKTTNVVNYPTDNGVFDHTGERLVTSHIYVVKN